MLLNPYRFGGTMLLDLLPTGAGSGYSTRKLRTAYAGSAIRVRRSSDSAEMDVGFTSGGDLDSSAMLTWSGSDSVFVKTWYDQSGNAVDATQTTAANQPRIANAGVLDTLNSRPTLVFDGSNDALVSGFSSAVLGTRNFTCAVLEKSANTSQNTGVFALGRTGVEDYRGGYLLNRRTTNLSSGLGSGSANTVFVGYQTADSNTSALSMFHYFITPTTSTHAMYIDRTLKTLNQAYVSGSASVSTFINSGSGSHRVIIGGTVDGNMTNTIDKWFAGSISEVVLWPSNLVASRVVIENSQQPYFGTP